MMEALINALTLNETDIIGALKRFGGNKELYIACLKMFLEDPTLSQLNDAVSRQAWDDAFTAAHALKGLAGNMGFVPLMHSTGQLLIIIRGGRTKEVSDYLAQVNKDYRKIINAIRECVSQSCQ